VHPLLVLAALVVTAVCTHAWARRKYRKRYQKQYQRADTQRLNAVFRPAPNPDALHLFTVATRPDPALDRLAQSCHRQGIGLHVLGLGNLWQGFGNKWLWTLEYLRLQQLPADAIVAFVDAYDVLCLADAAEIVKRFRHRGARIILSAETGCYPDPEMADRYPAASTRFRFLNSGGLIAYAGDLMRVIEAISFQTTDDDQRNFTRYFLAHPDEIELDTRCEFFVSLFGLSENDFQLDREAGRVTLRETGTQPCFLHGNGTSVSLLWTLGQQLGLCDAPSGE
jgi:hypothetical protein